jgi:uncharacterized membrane protein
VVLTTHPTTTTSLPEIIERASVGVLSGTVVFSGMMLFYTGLVVLGINSFWVSRMKKGLPAGHPERMASRHREVD